MTYSEALEYLYHKLPMFQRQGGAAFKKDLTNIRLLLAELGNPEQQFRSIHIAGTNGKGSTTHLIAAALTKHGYRTGIYTSPHYRDFRERIKIGNELIDKRAVRRFVAQHRALIERVRPSFFEITVAMAFSYFAEMKVDVAVVEVGLGGRLDSTNVTTPELSVITNISFDHQQFLGNTLEKIAGEKAGIIKPGVPVVIGQRQADIVSVFQKKADESQSPISWAEGSLKVEEMAAAPTGTIYRTEGPDPIGFERLEVELFGKYQLHNLRTALWALYQLDRTAAWFRLQPELLPQAWKHLKSYVHFIGRWEILGRRPLVIADSAHNEDGLREAMEQLAVTPRDGLHFVLGTVNDKDLAKMLPLLPKEARYYFCRPDIPRGLSAEALSEAAAGYDLQGQVYRSVRRALAAARRRADEADVIYVGGSTFVVAEVV